MGAQRARSDYFRSNSGSAVCVALKFAVGFWQPPGGCWVVPKFGAYGSGPNTMSSMAAQPVQLPSNNATKISQRFISSLLNSRRHTFWRRSCQAQAIVVAMIGENWASYRKATLPASLARRRAKVGDAGSVAYV